MARGIYTEKYDVFALRKGMFVSELDVPWADTNYPIRGFIIQNEKQIEELATKCRYVYVDQVKSVGLDLPKAHVSFEKKSSPRKTQVIKRNMAGLSSAKIKARRSSFGTEVYPIISKFKNEVKVANEILEQSMDEISIILSRGSDIQMADVASVKKFTSQIVSSAIRNPDALTWLCKIKNADKRTYSSLISSAVSGIMFARHVGLTRDKIEILAQALLLRGIGLAKLEKRHLIAYWPGDKDREYFQHVDLALEEIDGMKSINSLVSNTIANYCERFDGKGYPAKKEGIKIPLLSQMMSIVAFYEGSIHPWVQSRAISPAKAISNLFAEVGKLFSQDLVEQFVQMTGIYPIGCLVQLSDASLAVVIEQNKNQRLRPKVAVVKDANQIDLYEPKVIDLFEKQESGGATILRGVASKNMASISARLSSSLLEEKQGFQWNKPKTWLKAIA